MKKLKLIPAIISILLCTNLLLAQKPENLSDILLTKLNKDVALTDSQKVIIKKNVSKLIVKMQDANKETNSEKKLSTKKTASDDYKVALDSVLTVNQREQLKVKIKMREDKDLLTH